MSHESFRERLTLRLYGELSGAELRDLEGHLESCADCSRFAAELAAGLGRLRELERDPVPPADWDEELFERTRRGALVPRRWSPILAFAAGLAAGLLVSLAPRGARPGSRGGEESAEVASLRMTNAGESPPFRERAAPPPPTASRAQLPPLARVLKPAEKR